MLQNIKPMGEMVVTETLANGVEVTKVVAFYNADDLDAILVDDDEE